MPTLRKIADIQLGGKTYAIGKNGNYVLVDESELDAWGRKIATVIDFPGLIVDPEFKNRGETAVQDLIDALGRLVEEVESMKMERSRRIGQGVDQ